MVKCKRRKSKIEIIISKSKQLTPISPIKPLSCLIKSQLFVFFSFLSAFPETKQQLNIILFFNVNKKKKKINNKIRTMLMKKMEENELKRTPFSLWTIQSPDHPQLLHYSPSPLYQIPKIILSPAKYIIIYRKEKKNQILHQRPNLLQTQINKWKKTTNSFNLYNNMKNFLMIHDHDRWNRNGYSKNQWSNCWMRRKVKAWKFLNCEEIGGNFGCGFHWKWGVRVGKRKSKGNWIPPGLNEIAENLKWESGILRCEVEKVFLGFLTWGKE